ncbi:hypothetical protein CKQ79_29775, partial [Klebsiella pneumoniae]
MGRECLRVNYRECEHLGGLPAVALPRGDLAARRWGRTARCGAGVPAGQLSRMRTSWRAAGRRAAEGGPGGTQ